jgi:hypothetical protein
MEPTPPTPQPAAPGQTLVEYVRTNRQNAAIGLAALAVLFLAATVFLAIRGFRTPPAPEAPAAAAPSDPDEPPELPKTPQTPAQIQNQYHLGWIGSLMAFLVVATAAAWLLAGPPPADEAKQRTEVRVLLLAVGGLLGVILVFHGLLFFYLWRDSLTSWLSRGDVRESKWALIPMLMMVLGTGLVFLAVQPARAEERNNLRLRRVVYGSNLGMTVVLLLIVLVVGNVVFAMRLPNQLDTTASGFYSLSPQTQELVKRLQPGVTIHAVLPDAGRPIDDVRQLLTACEDASAGRLKVRFINPTSNKTALADLIGRYPKVDTTLNDRLTGGWGALVLALEPNGQPSKVIPVQSLFDRQTGRLVGEGLLFRELTLLADNQTKPVVYFTQSNGELSIDPATQKPHESAARLRSYLEKLYLDVRPLELGGAKPAVPGDAAVVIVAGPTQPFREPAIDALRAYLNTPRGEKKEKGKLIVLAGVIPGPDGQGMEKTGLEGLLGELNVRTGDRYVYRIVEDPTHNPLILRAAFVSSGRGPAHPIVANIARAVERIEMFLSREVLPTGTNPALQASVLLASTDPTWLEENAIRSQFFAAQKAILQQDALQVAKQFIPRGRPLGVTVVEGTTPRAAVYGSSRFVSDEEAEDLPPDTPPDSFSLIGETVGWLREAPSAVAVDIKAKQYEEYKFPEASAVSATRLVYLPLLLGLLTVVGLGVGVWVARRK